MKKTNSEYIQKISDKFRQNAVPENSAPMKNYMKNRFEFFGIKSPERKVILKEFFAENGLPGFEDLENIVSKLLLKYFLVMQLKYKWIYN